jgi:hypothetical protein
MAKSQELSVQQKKELASKEESSSPGRASDFHRDHVAVLPLNCFITSCQRDSL